MTKRRFIAALALLCAAITSASAHAVPPVRAHHTMVYDAVQQRVLMMGGSTSNDGGKTYVTFDDMWSFNGAWTAATMPGLKRSGVALAFDTQRKRVLGFGGYCPCKTTESGRYTDLMEMQNGEWKSVASIPARPTTDGRMVYDQRRGRLVLFGGAGVGQSRWNDTWEYDGSAWKKFDGDGPGDRAAFAMAYDASRGKTVLFGGFSGATDTHSEVWEFDGASWTRINSDGPALRTASMVYDSRRHRMIVRGDTADTWSWDGRAWTKLAPDGPPARFMGEMAYDEARDRVVFFGGRPGLPHPDLNDTWEWDGSRWTAIK